MTEAERIDELTAQAKKGDKGAFESLYDLYGKRVYYFCHCLLGEEEVAVETTCSVFLYAWRNLRSLPAGQTFYRWVCGNAFYFAKIALAGLRGSGVTIEETDGDPSLFDSMARRTEQDVSEINVRRSHLEAVTELLSGLPDADRICVLLYDYACFPVEEVAGIVGCSVDTVKCRVYNGHRALCEGLEARTPGDGELFRPFLDKLIRTCGKNCTMPASVTERTREGLREDSEMLFPAPDLDAQEPKKRGPSAKTITLLCILFGVLFAGALVYVIYWFLSAPKPPADGSLPSDDSSYTVQMSDPASDDLSEDASDSASEDSPSGDESEPGATSEESEIPLPESSEPADTSSEESEREPQPLPRATENLRLRSTPDTSVSDNLVAMIPKGAHIDILETVTTENGEVWYKARYTVSAGLWYEGYCSAEFVETE